MKILLGICGSIASYRSPDLVKALVKEGHDVRCVLTNSARSFVGEKALETFSQNKSLSNDAFANEHQGTEHIASARWAETMVFYGATAHRLAKCAHGLADDFLTTQYLAFEGPVIFVPAMNPSMWNHPSTNQNIQTLKSYGNKICGPISGKVACGESGLGHVEENSKIIEFITGAKSL